MKVNRLFNVGQLTLIPMILSVLGCTSPLSSSVIANEAHVKSDKLVIQLPRDSKNAKSIMKLKFQGVGGFAFDVNGDKVITAPFYSTPPFLNNIPLVPITSNHACIDGQFPNSLWDINNYPGQRVNGIIIGPH